MNEIIIQKNQRNSNAAHFATKKGKSKDKILFFRICQKSGNVILENWPNGRNAADQTKWDFVNYLLGCCAVLEDNVDDDGGDVLACPA